MQNKMQIIGRDVTISHWVWGCCRQAGWCEG